MNILDMETSFWKFYYHDCMSIVKLLIKLGIRPTFRAGLITSDERLLSPYHDKIIDNFYIKEIHLDGSWHHTYEIIGVKENE